MSGVYHKQRQRARRSLTWSGWLGTGLLLLILIPALAAPLLAPYDPAALARDLKLAGPSWQHPLGTDLLGRDQLSRLLYGGQMALGISLLVVATAVGIGGVVGGVAGYGGGVLDELISWLLAVILTLPGLSLTIALVAILGPSATTMFLALSATAWAGYARLFRGAVLAVRQQPYLEAAHAVGAPTVRILLRHVAPNVARPLLALASLNLANGMLALAGLSFLGLGIQPPQADWGTMLNDARPYVLIAPHLAIPPALCIVTVALSATLLTDALLTDTR